MMIPVPAFVYAVEPDSYEQDNTFAQARVIILKDESPQYHNFHETGDQDWVKFYGLEGKKYEVKTENLGTDCDAVIELYDITGVNLVGRQNAGLEGEGETLTSEPLPADGIYYIKVYNDSQTSGGNTGYELRLTLQNAPVSARFQGSTVNAVSKAPLGNVMLRTDQDFTALSDLGNYTMYHPVSQSLTTAYTLTARLPGYEIFTKPVFTTADGFMTTSDSDSVINKKKALRPVSRYIPWDGTIELIPIPLRGDINGDLKVDLADAVLGLQVLAGMESQKIRKDYIESHIDVSGDDNVGIEEVIYILGILQDQTAE